MREREQVDVLASRVRNALEAQLAHAHSDNASKLWSKIVERLPVLRLLASKHNEVLQRFKRQHPDIELPALHRELFSDELATDEDFPPTQK